MGQPSATPWAEVETHKTFSSFQVNGIQKRSIGFHVECSDPLMGLYHQYNGLQLAIQQIKIKWKTLECFTHKDKHCFVKFCLQSITRRFMLHKSSNKLFLELSLSGQGVPNILLDLYVQILGGVETLYGGLLLLVSKWGGSRYRMF